MTLFTVGVRADVGDQLPIYSEQVNTFSLHERQPGCDRVVEAQRGHLEANQRRRASVASSNGSTFARPERSLLSGRQARKREAR